MLRIAQSALPALSFLCLLFPMTVNAGARSNASRTMKVDRRHVSHILHERRDGRNYLTLLVSYPFPWSYKAASHPVRRECGDAGECAALLRQIDAHLVQGFEIELVIENGEISAMTFLTQ